MEDEGVWLVLIEEFLEHLQLNVRADKNSSFAPAAQANNSAPKIPVQPPRRHDLSTQY